LKPLLTDRSVLDIGSASRHRRPDWMHGLVCGVASHVVGVDRDEATVVKLQERGYDIRVGDAQDFDVGEKFDIVLAGELIEHLDNVHGFLQSVHRHLGPDGRLVLTTPNPFYFMNFVYRVGGRPRVNAEHTCWFCPDTIGHVLERNDFEIVELRFIGHRSPSRFRRVVTGVARAVLPKNLRDDTMLVVARPAL
jgi:2-polyprenyl-3-methyl-5-hydroxy-6-metoxy-1,4-benzoquinol methylase